MSKTVFLLLLFSVDSLIRLFLFHQNFKMKQINVQELKKMIDNQVDFQLIDCREQNEYNQCNIQGTLIPMSEIPARFEEISKDKPVVVQCRSGMRSASVIQFLEQNYGYTNLANLEGGIFDWIRQIDPSLSAY
jgi:rhodanese-related sulfurtransferase